MKKEMEKETAKESIKNIKIKRTVMVLFFVI